MAVVAPARSSVTVSDLLSRFRDVRLALSRFPDVGLVGFTCASSRTYDVWVTALWGPVSLSGKGRCPLSGHMFSLLNGP